VPRRNFNPDQRARANREDEMKGSALLALTTLDYVTGHNIISSAKKG
jgi:hypothetical protein